MACAFDVLYRLQTLPPRDTTTAPHASPPIPQVGTALDDVNDSFHAHYGEARVGTAHEAPVILVLLDALIVHHRGLRQSRTFTPRRFHVIKSCAHAPVAVYAALYRLAGQPLDSGTTTRLRALEAALRRSRASLDDEHQANEANKANEANEKSALDNLHTLLDESLSLLRDVAAAGHVDPLRLDAFARDMGRPLRASTDDATRIQLAALHEQVCGVLATFDDDEKRSFHVVVTGDHQARVRSLAMQYFQKLVGDRPGSEHRVLYGEGVADEESALALVGTFRLDRTIAAAFFGDEKRLQRDVLGDATHERLAAFEMPSLP